MDAPVIPVTEPRSRWLSERREDSSALVGLQSRVAAIALAVAWCGFLILGLFSGGVENVWLYTGMFVAIGVAYALLLLAPGSPVVRWASLGAVVAEVAAATSTPEEEFVSPLEGALDPTVDLQSTPSAPAHAEPEERQVVLAADAAERSLTHDEVHPVDDPAAVPAESVPAPAVEPTPAAAPSPTPAPESPAAGSPEVSTPAPPAPAPTADPASGAGADARTAGTAAAGAPVEPARGAEEVRTGQEEQEGRPGFFKRLFGRKG